MSTVTNFEAWGAEFDIAKAVDDFTEAFARLGVHVDEPPLRFVNVAVDRVFDTGPYPFVPIPCPATPVSASPRNNTVDIRPNADGTTSLHIDKTQVRLRFGAESEERVEIVLEPKGKANV